MKDEDAFNAYLSKEIGKLQPEIAKLKMAEKYHVGIPDFCLWCDGMSVVFESKFIPTLGAAGSKASVLKHPFTGPQQTFLQTLLRAGTPSFGLIGIGDVRQMILIPADLIPSSGTFSCGQLVGLAGPSAPMIEFKNVELLVDMMFSYRVENGACTLIENGPPTRQ